MKINRSNIWNKLELISLIGMLLVGFLQICSLTFGKKILFMANIDYWFYSLFAQFNNYKEVQKR